MILDGKLPSTAPEYRASKMYTYSAIVVVSKLNIQAHLTTNSILYANLLLQNYTLYIMFHR